MYLEHVSTGQLVGRADKMPNNWVIETFDVQKEEQLNDSYNLTLVAPDINITIEDAITARQTEFIVWLDQAKTINMGAFVVFGVTQQYWHEKQDGNPLLSFKVTGKCFKSLFDRERFSIFKTNITMQDFIIEVINTAAPGVGVSLSTTYIQNMTTVMAKIEYIEKTASEILDDLWNDGVSWYIDHNKVVHAWDNTTTEYAFNPSGYTIDDTSKMVSQFDVGIDAGTGIKNRIKIVGKDRKSLPIQKKITGTGDPLNSLDFNLEFNPYIDDYSAEEWISIDSNVWTEVDPGINIKAGHDGEGYLFTSEEKLVCWGGTGIIGDVGIYKVKYVEYKDDGYTFGTFKINNGGMAYINGITNGNGIELKDISAGFKVDGDKITKVVVDGQEHSPTSTINLKRLIDSNMTNLSSDRKSFDIDAGDAPYVAIGDTFLILGTNLPLTYVKVINKASNTITIDQIIPADADLTDAKMTRDPWYNTRILFTTSGLTFQIQGEAYGEIGSGAWTTIYTTSEKPYIPPFVYEFQVISEDLEAYFERLITVPPESFSFITDTGEIYSIAPEEYANSGAAQIILHPGDDKGSPSRLSFRAAPFIACVDTNANNSTTTIYYYGQSGSDLPMVGDRVMINGMESYISSVTYDVDNDGMGVLQLSPALSSIPSYQDIIYFRTTMLPIGTTGTFTYSYNIENAWEFSDLTSIGIYGTLDGEPINDDRFKDFNDLEAKANAYLAYNAYPRGSGSLSFNVNKTIKSNAFLQQGLVMPEPGQYFTVQSTQRGISSTLVRINSLTYNMLSPDIVECTVQFNRDDYNDTVFERQINRRLIDVSANRTDFLFQSQRNSDSFGMTDDVNSIVYNINTHGSFYYG